MTLSPEKLIRVTIPACDVEDAVFGHGDAAPLCGSNKPGWENAIREADGWGAGPVGGTGVITGRY